MITHIALIGEDPIIAEVIDPPIDGISDAQPIVVMSAGPSLAIHMTRDQAERAAEALIDAVIAAGDVVTRPHAYMPAWRPA